MISDKVVMDGIINALKSGVSIDMFIYMPSKAPKSWIISDLYKMSEIYHNLRLHAMEDGVLHAKVMVVDYKHTLIGSANLTFGGMVKNYELGVLIDSPEVASEVINIIKRV